MATQVVVAETRNKIAILFYPKGDAMNGVSVSTRLSPAEARQLVQDIQYELAQLGTAADLGEVVS